MMRSAFHSVAFSSFSDQCCDKMIKFLQSHCLYEGGYGGGFMQIPHLATTYAAINILISLRDPAALKSIDRQTLSISNEDEAK